MHCTLLIPDLLWPPDLGDEPYRDLAVPALTRLLSRGRCTRFAALSMEAWLCTAFEVERQHDWPIAPLTLALDGGESATGYWLRCDPVHLRALRAQLQLVELSGFMPSAEEAQALVAALNAHFTGQGLDFHAARPHRWYLRLDRAPALVTRGLPEVAGKDIDRYLPAGDERMRWHRLLNEVQMLLHAHPVNEARESRGEPAINSVWLWGGGVKPAVSGRHFTSVWSDDALACALAVANGIPCLPVPATAARLLAAPGRDAEKPLAVLPPLRAAASGGDIEQWRALLQTLERDWFVPLYQALRGRRLASLALVALCADQCRRYDLAAGDSWKFWRPLRPLAQHA